MSSETRPVADINITPLIDVMLVLLIIFMVVVPVSRRGLDAALPDLSSGGGEHAPTPVMITVDATGLRLDAKPVLTVADLARDLRDLLASRAGKTVLVRASGGVRYARVVDVLDVARGAGAERIGLVPDGVVTPPAPGR